MNWTNFKNKFAKLYKGFCVKDRLRAEAFKSKTCRSDDPYRSLAPICTILNPS